LIKHFVVTGPESSGKTTLARELISSLDLVLVDEYARSYLDTLPRPYNASDLDHIATVQISAEIQKKKMIFDTDLLTTYIWMEEVYDTCRLDWLESLSSNTEKLYLLCKPDIPWVPDPQRENPSDRDRLYEKYKLYLELLNLQYVEIYGDYDTRLQLAIQAVKEIN
jgi:nicotinamide riboside kinase